MGAEYLTAAEADGQGSSEILLNRPMSHLYFYITDR